MTTSKSRQYVKSSGSSSSGDSNGIRFPLPEHVDASLCRDEFLRTILKQDERKEETLEDSYTRPEIHTMPMSGEGMAVLELLQKKHESKFISTISQYRLSLTAAELEMLYKVCLVQTQKASMQFLFMRLKKQITTLMRIWPGEVDPIPHKLFNWSKEHFTRRLHIDQTYLDVLVIERTECDLDCTKFCIDLQEVIMLIDTLMIGFIKDLDLCDMSRMLDDLNFQVSATWARELNALRQEHKRLESMVREYENLEESHSTADIIAEYDKAETLMMIELRYRINWLHSCGEQHVMWLQAKENQYEEEISELMEKIQQDTTIFGHLQFVYQYQIDNYRMSIDAWQEQLDTDLEAAELKCNATQSQLVKARDDLKFFQEQTVMFRRRIAEVLELIEGEEASQRSIVRRRTVSQRRSVKFLSMGKKQKKKKKKE